MWPHYTYLVVIIIIVLLLVFVVVIVYSETNLLKLAMLEITSGGGHRGTQDSAPLPCPVLPLLYLSTQGHEKITARLAEDNIFKRSTPYHSHWSVLMPRMVEILIHELYPLYN